MSGIGGMSGAGGAGQPAAEHELYVQLYTKSGCHLCEDVAAELRRLGRRYPHRLEQIDISVDEELLARHGLQIPVLVVGGREYAAPLERATIERALADATVATFVRGEAL